MLSGKSPIVIEKASRSRIDLIAAGKGRPWRMRRGGAVLEMAIVLSLLMSLTFGMVEFAYCFYCKNMMVGAAREGARNAIVNGSTTASVSTAVTNALSTMKWPASYYTVAITDTSNNPINLSTVTVGTQVMVSVSGTWGTLGSGFSPLQLISKSKTVTGSCVMRKEQ